MAEWINKQLKTLTKSQLNWLILFQEVKAKYNLD